MSQSTKMRGCQTAQKGGGEGAENAELKERKGLLIQKMKKTNQMLDRQIFCNLV